MAATKNLAAAVTHVTPLMFGDEGVWGGGERYALELARAQSKHRRTKLIGFGKHGRRDQEGDLEVVVLPTRWRYRNPLNPLSTHLFGELAGSETVHVHQYETLLTDLVLIDGRLKGRRVFVTDLAGSAPNLGPLLARPRLLTGHLALSNYAAGFYPELASKTRVLYGGADLQKFSPGDDQRSGVVYVGRLMPHKGIDVLIDAIDADMSLSIYGRAYHPDYRAFLAKRAEGKNIRFIESATDEEIVAAYRSARVSVLASVPETKHGQAGPKSELLGLVLVEALACGTPVVCSDFGPLPEISPDGLTGFVVPPGDYLAMRTRLKELLTNDGLWRRMSEAAAQRAQQEFTWDTVARKALHAYDTMN